MASKTESLAMCETGHEHAANKETHKPRVHTKHDKHESTQPVKTQVTCHAEQDKTRESKTKATNAHGQSSARPEQTRYTKPELSLKQDKSAGIRTPCSNIKQNM